MEKEILNKVTTFKQHKWDKITDTCVNCGVKRRKRIYYSKSATMILAKITEYFVNNEWTSSRPNCDLIKK